MIQRDIEYSGQFLEGYKGSQKRHKDMNKLKYLMTALINNTLPLPAVYKDHPLQGSWKGYRDAHVEPDWILIYNLPINFYDFENWNSRGALRVKHAADEICKPCADRLA